MYVSLVCEEFPSTKNNNNWMLLGGNYKKIHAKKTLIPK